MVDYGPDRMGRFAGGCLALSIALITIVGLLGPSAAQPPLPQRRWQPPYWFTVNPSPWLVTTLLLVAVLAGAAGLWLGLRALKRGWAPAPRRLIVASLLGVIAMVVVPPMGSADHLVYAAYGRIAATGGDPYTETPQQLAERGDPIGQAVEAPWQDTPSIYGPLGTAEQWLAARLGGMSTHTTVFILSLLGAVAFLVTGLLLQRLAGSDPAARGRVALLWSVNPLLLYEVVNGSHIDAIAVVWVVAALVVLRRSATAAGTLVGLACAVKLSFGLYGLALAWAVRRQPRRLVTLLISWAIIGGGSYLLVGPHVVDQVRTASRFVSQASIWRLPAAPLEALLGFGFARDLIRLLAWPALAAVAVLLARGLSRKPVPVGDRVTGEAIRAAAILTFAWLLTAPYSLPWYDVAAWAPCALLAASRFDELLIARTTAMTCAYIPGRAMELPHGLELITRNLRGVVTPVLAAVLLGVVLYQCGLPRRWRPRSADLPG